jgi:hypothetical protein
MGGVGGWGGGGGVICTIFLPFYILLYIKHNNFKQHWVLYHSLSVEQKCLLTLGDMFFQYQQWQAIISLWSI